jgi:hypothetical protein
MRLTNYADRDILTPEEQVQLDKWVCSVANTQDDVEGFAHFYAYMTRGDIPQHAYNWMDKIYLDKSNDMGTLIFAFRGSWKTTTISILFTAFRIGKHPYKTNLVLGNNDASAQNITLAIADIIEKDPRWRDIFPNVVPDKKKGWGAQGYWVRDTGMDDDEWAERTNISKDPSLLGVGVASGSVIGKHPTGVLLMDDIHDEGNSISELERSKIVKIVTDTVLPMAVTDATKEEGQQLETYCLIVGTPWHESDGYHYLRDTGEFGFLYSPLMYPCSEETEGAVHFDHKNLQGWFRLAWEERIPYKAVISLYNKSGHRGFGRMYLLSLAMANDLGLEYSVFPHEELPDADTLEHVSGVDYASMIEVRGKVMQAKNRSKFALATACILPTRVCVITGGVVGHFTQLKAEGHVQSVQSRYKRHRTTGVEMNGKGEEFFSLLSRHQEMDLFPYWTGKSKKETRIEMQLGPWLEMGKIMVSDEDTPFLNELRKALAEFPHGNLDVLDAVFGVSQVIPDILVVNTPEKEKAKQKIGKRVTKNPFSAFGARRYGS